jgi:hypothetical protein
MSNRIEKLEPPAIPFSYGEYDLSLQNQKDNVFRLFFNRLVSLLSSLLSIDNGGKFLYFPYARFYCAAGQTLALADTAYPVGYNTVEFSNGITLVDDTKITFAVAGIYKINGILQLKNSSGTLTTVFVWLEKNGTKIDYSTHEYQMQGVVTSQIAHSMNLVQVEATDEIEVMWAATTTDVFLLKDDPTTLHPGVPCAEVAVHFVSNLP